MRTTIPQDALQKMKSKVDQIEVKVGATGKVWARTKKEHGGSGAWYEIKASKTGLVYCACLGWLYSAATPKNKLCKHVLAVFEDDAAMKKISKALKEKTKKQKSIAWK